MRLGGDGSVAWTSEHSSGHSYSTHPSSRSFVLLEITSPGFWSWQSSKVSLLYFLCPMLAYINHVTHFPLVKLTCFSLSRGKYSGYQVGSSSPLAQIKVQTIYIYYIY